VELERQKKLSLFIHVKQCSGNNTKKQYFTCKVAALKLNKNHQPEGMQPSFSTYVDVTLLVALVEVKQDGSFMQISQHGHVFYPINAGLVHWQDLFSGKRGLGILEYL